MISDLFQSAVQIASCLYDYANLPRWFDENKELFFLSGSAEPRSFRDVGEIMHPITWTAHKHTTNQGHQVEF